MEGKPILGGKQKFKCNTKINQSYNNINIDSTSKSKNLLILHFLQELTQLRGGGEHDLRGGSAPCPSWLRVCNPLSRRDALTVCASSRLPNSPKREIRPRNHGVPSGRRHRQSIHARNSRRPAAMKGWNWTGMGGGPGRHQDLTLTSRQRCHIDRLTS